RTNRAASWFTTASSSGCTPCIRRCICTWRRPDLGGLIMRHCGLLALSMAISISLAAAQEKTPAEKPLVLNVWPGKAPGLTGDAGEEKILPQKEGEKPVKRITDVTKPTLTIYRPAKDKDTGAAVLICPGGGYHILAWDLEGEEVATWLNSIGVTGIVLKYRVPRPSDTPKDAQPIGPLQDAQRALSLVRSKAGEWKLDPKRIGVLGFSAGGHLSAATATNFDKRAYEAIDDIDKVSSRPDFAVLVYPAYLWPRTRARRRTTWPRISVFAKNVRRCSW